MGCAQRRLTHYNGIVAAPLIPTPLDQVGRRPFLFYPAIVGIEHNEWTLRRVSSSEVQVINTKTAEELWIPRRFLGEVSAIEAPFIIAGLVKELEYADGAVAPHRRRVIEMPRAVNGPASANPVAANLVNASPSNTAPAPAKLAPVIGIRVESGPSSRTGRRLLTWAVAGILTCVIGAEALMVFGGHRRIISAPPPHRHGSVRN
jgi:hypothetical protein